MRKYFLLIFLLVVTSFVNAQMFHVDTLYYNGDANNRINLLIMGDGYDSTEMHKFEMDAESVADYFFTIPPFSTYRNFFNVYSIDLISNESGNDHPQTAGDCPGSQPITSVDNYLETTFDNGGVHRCVYSSNIGQIYAIANTYVPYWDYVNVVVNTNYYGGCAGNFAFTTMHSSSAEIFVHEFGHMFGGLADEYDSGNVCPAGTSQNINVSQQTDTSLLVWKKWLTTSPIPTPSGTLCSQVGLYEGANNCLTNWYRPKCDCKMRNLFQPFCEVCNEQFIYKISTLINTIENFLPLDTNINLCQGAQQPFNVSVINNADNTIRVQWFVDNNLVVNNDTAYNFNSSVFPPGMHERKVVAMDTTLAVRKQLNSYSQTWHVQIIQMPAANVTTTGPASFCMPDSVKLFAQTGIQYSYNWMRNNVVMAGAVDSIYNVIVTGNYALIVSNSGCSDTSGVIHFNVYPRPNSSIGFPGNDSSCFGAPVVLAGVNCNTCSYQWSSNGIYIPGADQPDYSAFSTGYYTLNITDSVSNCSAVSDSQFVYVSNFNAQISTNHITTICENDSVTFLVQPSGYLYQWRDDLSILPGKTDSILTVHLAGHYDVIVTDGLCRDTSNVIAVIVNTSPIVSFGGLPTIVCLNDPIFNLYGIPGGGTFSGNGIVGSDFNPGLAGLGTHSISYYYVDNNGCPGTAVKVVVVDICNGVVSQLNEDAFDVYPNPTTGRVMIDFLLKKETIVNINIFDAIGNNIKTINNSALTAGKNNLNFDLNLNSGIYIVEINVEGKRLIRKLAVIK